MGAATNSGQCAAVVVAVAALTAIAGCSVSSKQSAYSYLGRVIEKTPDVDLARPNPDPSVRAQNQATFGVVGAPIVESLTSTYGTKYQRYTVQLEMGEKVSLRSKRESISVGDCARVWIDGPGVSPVYLYAPDQAEIDKADGCSK